MSLVLLTLVGAAIAAVAWVLGTGGPAAGAILTLILVAGGLALGRFGRTARRTAVALDEIVEAARQVEAGDLSARVSEPIGGMASAQDLARAFNTMAGRLESDERQRRSLLADVSHELRTPLAVIQGELEAIQDGVHPADEAHVSALLDETQVMARLIEDLRTVALSEAGTLRLHPEATDLGVLLADVAAAFRIAADTRDLTLAVDAAEDLPALEVDPVRIREVLANLVANAIAHAPPGGVVRLELRTEPGWQVLRVADAGPGIDPAILPHVFDRFVKGADSRGSGLGLAIARSLVESHGGSITATSSPGEGTTVTVRLPDEPAR